MKKFFKTIFVMGGTALAGYFGYKAYKHVNGVIKLSKTLGEFLKNVYGEGIEVRQCMGNLRNVSLKIAVTQDIFDKYNDIEATVREYVDDFYPELAKGTKIEVYVKGTEEEEKCCCNGENHEDGKCPEDMECCQEKE